MEPLPDFLDLVGLLGEPPLQTPGLQAAQGTGSFSAPPLPNDLDAFLLEGDDHTWAVDDWNWDPAQLCAAPRQTPAAPHPTAACCHQALPTKRPRVDTPSACTACTWGAERSTSLSIGSVASGSGAAAAACAGGAGGSAAPAACCGGGLAASASLPEGFCAPLPCANAALSPQFPSMMHMVMSSDGGGGGGSVDGGSFPMGVHTHYPGMCGPSLGGAPWPDAAAWMASPAGLQLADPAAGGTFGGSADQFGCMPGAFGYPAGVPALSGGVMTAAPPGIAAWGSGGYQPWGALPYYQQQQQGQPGAAAAAVGYAAASHCNALSAAPDAGFFAALPGAGFPQQPPSSHAGAGKAAPASRPPVGAKNLGKAAARSTTPNAVRTQRRPADDSDLESDLSDDEHGGVSGGMHATHAAGVPASAATFTGDMSTVAVLAPSDDGCLGTCQVAGCGKDLTGLKDYHQRYRICEVHIRLPQVLREGALQRFCQQCGRFHELSAFDGCRKSCREQLSKHNARRRRRTQTEHARGKVSAEALANGADEGGGGGGPGGGGLVAALLADPQQLQALRRALGFPTHPALPLMQPYRPEQDMGGVPPLPAPEPPSYGLARAIADGHGSYAPQYESEHRSLRISMKLFNKTPADLPRDLLDQLTAWLGSAPAGVSGHIRPGCVFLTLQLLLDVPTYVAAERSGLCGLLDHLLHRSGCAFWHQGTFLAQMLGSLCVVADGTVRGGGAAVGKASSPATAPAGQPLLAAVRAGQGCAMVGTSPATVRLAGRNLDAPGTEVLCRYGGQQHRLPLQLDSPTRGTCTLPALPGCGVAWVELVRRGYVSAARPLLVVDDPDIADEVAELGRGRTAAWCSASQRESVLVDLALLLQHAALARAATAAGAPAGALPAAALSLKSRRMLALACDCGWAAVAARMLPLAAADTPAATVAAVHAACAAPIAAAAAAASVMAGTTAAPVAGGGLSLLHRAVRSGCPRLVAGVLAWGKAQGWCWRPDLAGPGDLTPLHLSALLEEPLVALMLLDHMAESGSEASGGRSPAAASAAAAAAASAFTALAAPDGVTPFHLAFQMGYWSVDTLLSHLVPLAPGARGGGGGHGSLAAAPSSHMVPPAPMPDGGGAEDEESVEPCTVCQSTVAPLVLSVTAACSDCGERQRCLREDGSARRSGASGGDGTGGPHSSAGSGAAGGGRAVKSCSDDAGVALTDGQRGTVWRDGNGVGGGVKRGRSDSHRSGAGVGSEIQAVARVWSSMGAVWGGAVAKAKVGGGAGAGEVSCQHQHGACYSITAICQSCHANRILTVT